MVRLSIGPVNGAANCSSSRRKLEVALPEYKQMGEANIPSKESVSTQTNSGERWLRFKSRLCHLIALRHCHNYLILLLLRSLQSCPTLCDPIDGSPPGFPVPVILQARTLEWVVISFSNAWKWKMKVKSLSRVPLSDPMDCSPPGSSVHGIFQARVREWGAIALSELNPRVSVFSCVKWGSCDLHQY